MTWNKALSRNRSWNLLQIQANALCQSIDFQAGAHTCQLFPQQKMCSSQNLSFGSTTCTRPGIFSLIMISKRTILSRKTVAIRVHNDSAGAEEETPASAPLAQTQTLHCRELHTFRKMSHSTTPQKHWFCHGSSSMPVWRLGHFVAQHDRDDHVKMIGCWMLLSHKTSNANWHVRARSLEVIERKVKKKERRRIPTIARFRDSRKRDDWIPRDDNLTIFSIHKFENEKLWRPEIEEINEKKVPRIEIHDLNIVVRTRVKNSIRYRWGAQEIPSTKGSTDEDDTFDQNMTGSQIQQSYDEESTDHVRQVIVLYKIKKRTQIPARQGTQKTGRRIYRCITFDNTSCIEYPLKFKRYESTQKGKDEYYEGSHQ